jgi:hypothetical protein
MDTPFDLTQYAASRKKNATANVQKMAKLEKTAQKAGDQWKKLKEEKKTAKMIPAVITNPRGARHVGKNFIVRPKKFVAKKPEYKGKVIVMKADIDDDITVKRKVFVSTKKVSHPKLQKLLRGKHGK